MFSETFFFSCARFYIIQAKILPQVQQSPLLEVLRYYTTAF